VDTNFIKILFTVHTSYIQHRPYTTQTLNFSLMVFWQTDWQCPSWEEVSYSRDTWLDSPISLATWLCDFINLSWEKLLSQVTTDTGSLTQSGSLLKCLGNVLSDCVCNKYEKISRRSLWRNYTQSSTARVNISAMFSVYQRCSGVGTRYPTFLHQ